MRSTKTSCLLTYSLFQRSSLQRVLMSKETLDPHNMQLVITVKLNCKSLPFFYFLTFEKADCSIFVLSVGRSTSPLIFLLKTSYFSFPVHLLLHKKDIFFLQIFSKDGASMRYLHCFLGLVMDSILSFRSVRLLVF